MFTTCSYNQKITRAPEDMNCWLNMYHYIVLTGAANLLLHLNLFIYFLHTTCSKYWRCTIRTIKFMSVKYKCDLHKSSASPEIHATKHTCACTEVLQSDVSFHSQIIFGWVQTPACRKLLNQTSAKQVQLNHYRFATCIILTGERQKSGEIKGSMWDLVASEVHVFCQPGTRSKRDKLPKPNPIYTYLMDRHWPASTLNNIS